MLLFRTTGISKAVRCGGRGYQVAGISMGFGKSARDSLCASDVH